MQTSQEEEERRGRVVAEVREIVAKKFPGKNSYIELYSRIDRLRVIVFEQKCANDIL